ncbi:hypothetical protein EVAR_35514_1 [Eumeta japonica]|uniref:Reverse transcriptase zinc-binding domain-containing protein n=1 Tax=Eumeta variegata TaxID=151549 RepID=A0A4C1X905_EUMVA|nr:hypothetical protein EVAR_35514_1 [Eumeta japonica]
MPQRRVDVVGTWLFSSHFDDFDDSPECPSCPGIIEDAEHAFFECPHFNQKREELKMVLNQNIQPETIVDAMLTSEVSWKATSTLAAEVLIDLRSIKRRRANDAK